MGGVGLWPILSPGPPRFIASDRTKINAKDGAEMIFIPTGDFLMGDDDQRDNPRHRVTLTGYWIYKNLVTVGMYRKFCHATGRKMPSEPLKHFNSNWSKADHPIVNVSWKDAQAYCDWAGMHLPTEAEWEKAARGTDGRLYAWGNEWDANKCQCSKMVFGDSGGTSAVGSYPSGASAYGLLDMAGNVDEWCSDWYDRNYMKTGPGINPTGPTSGGSRVVRGGSWDIYSPYGFRSASRDYVGPNDARDGYFGFRCASGL